MGAAQPQSIVRMGSCAQQFCWDPSSFFSFFLWFYLTYVHLPQINGKAAKNHIRVFLRAPSQL